MKSFKHHITEVMDKPAKWKEFSSSLKKKKAEFTIGDVRYEITLLFAYTNRTDTGPGSKEEIKSMSVEFSVGDVGGVSKGQGQKHDITGSGNAGKVFATVIDYVKDAVKKDKVLARIFFMGKEQSRQRLYKAIAQRFEKMGLVKNVNTTKGYIIQMDVIK
jgi:hypothetical protein